MKTDLFVLQLWEGYDLIETLGTFTSYEEAEDWFDARKNKIPEAMSYSIEPILLPIMSEWE